ncbi:MAG: DNRLRE domain-containing protein, partial [Gammaproteobacteria bacterium]|nr:DNRLRE domain-containing protein [Gammaproteobacteria bacterium]
MKRRPKTGLSPKGTVPSLKSQRGYLLITVVVMLFLVASIAMLLNYDSSISANTSTGELESARADYVTEAAMQHALWQSANNACMGGVTIPATALGSDSYTAAITGAAAGTAYTLAADQDAWIRNDDVTKNNGTTADQHLRFETGKVEQALTRFDLSSLPADAQINSATAWFYITSSGPGGGAHPEGPLTVHRVTADWTELGATWETMNGNFESSKLATIPAQPVDAVWVSINLTAQVQAWVNGQPNYGVLMASESEGVHGKYSSREDGGNVPRLEVVVG